jgi:hypothetical protein
MGSLQTLNWLVIGTYFAILLSVAWQVIGASIFAVENIHLSDFFLSKE